MKTVQTSRSVIFVYECPQLIQKFWIQIDLSLQVDSMTVFVSKVIVG